MDSLLINFNDSPSLLRRHNNILAGISELKSWLEDIVRNGIGNINKHDFLVWEEQAARMVDAQAGGIANLLRDIPMSFHAPDWIDITLKKIGHLFYILRSYENFEQLTNGFQQDLLQFIGYSYKKDDIRNFGEKINDIWWVIHQNNESVDNLTLRKTYFLGINHQKIVSILHFYHHSQPQQVSSWNVGSFHQGNMAFYPGSNPSRVIECEGIHEITPIHFPQKISSFSYIEKMLDQYLKINSQSPLQNYLSCILENVTPFIKNKEIGIIDQKGIKIPLEKTTSNNFWKILAQSGGHPITLFGEWNASFFTPKTILSDYTIDLLL